MITPRGLSAGARPLIGRNFTADEMAPNGPRAIMLAEGFWRRQFGGSPDVLGRVVRLDLGGEPDSRTSAIVGVMPASLFIPDFKSERPDIWLPLIDGGRRRTTGVAVRVKPGLSPEAASEELTAIFGRAGTIHPAYRPLQPQIRLSRPQDDLPFRQALILLTGAVIFLLLIACSNVSHLLLQRGVARERELAVRHALGAHRARLVRQLVTESTLLGGAGGALAMLVGWGALNLLARLRPTSLPALTYLSTTRGVIPLAAGLAIAVSMIRDMGERQMGSRNLTIAAAATTGMAFASAFETPEHPGVIRPSGFTGVNYVAPDYFSIMRMPLIAGRTFDEGSVARAEVIVSRSLARQLGYDGNVVGRQFRNSRREGALQQWQTVVGVAPDMLTNRLDRETKPMLYRPFPGNAPATSLIVRLRRHDAADVLRRFAKSVQPDPLTWRVTNVDEKIEQSIAEPRFTMSVLVLFAASGVLLAAIGLFGVVSYSLGVRAREIGVRITLGATRRHIAGLFARDALGQAALGTGIGLAGAAGVTQLTRMSFYGVHGFDTITFILAAASMLLVSLAACAGPIFRATTVDPAVALRAE